MVDIYKLKFTILQQEAFRYLVLYSGKSYNANQLAKRLGVSQTAIAKALPGLVKAGLVKREKDKETGRYAISFDRENPRNKYLKKAENIKLLYESGLPEFLQDEFPGAAVVLFGSFGRGDDVADSDIDIAIIGAKARNMDLSPYEKRFGREIVCNFYGKLPEVHKNLRDNLLNGVVLCGNVEP